MQKGCVYLAVGHTGPPSTTPGPTGPPGMDSAMPIGAIIMFYSSVPPPGWGLCDGSIYDTAIGPIQSPDLRGRFTVGFDASSPAIPMVAPDGVLNYGTVNNHGGKTINSLTVSQLAPHDHLIEVDPNGAHLHELFPRTRFISVDVINALLAPDWGLVRGLSTGNTESFEVPQTVDLFTSIEGVHTHDATASITGDGGPIENRPTYTVVNYIIKIA